MTRCVQGCARRCSALTYASATCLQPKIVTLHNWFRIAKRDKTSINNLISASLNEPVKAINFTGDIRHTLQPTNAAVPVTQHVHRHTQHASKYTLSLQTTNQSRFTANLRVRSLVESEQRQRNGTAWISNELAEGATANCRKQLAVECGTSGGAFIACTLRWEPRAVPEAAPYAAWHVRKDAYVPYREYLSRKKTCEFDGTGFSGERNPLYIYRTYGR